MNRYRIYLKAETVDVCADKIVWTSEEPSMNFYLGNCVVAAFSTEIVLGWMVITQAVG